MSDTHLDRLSSTGPTHSLSSTVTTIRLHDLALECQVLTPRHRGREGGIARWAKAKGRAVCGHIPSWRKSLKVLSTR